MSACCRAWGLEPSGQKPQKRVFDVKRLSVAVRPPHESAAVFEHAGKRPAKTTVLSEQLNLNRVHLFHKEGN